MALVTPLLMIIMFGSMELGYYFYSEHVVVKAVRDGARYASRQSFANFDCSDDADDPVDPGTIGNIQLLTRTNQLADADAPARLANWDDNSTVDVGLVCDTSGTYGAFYTGMNAVPVVVVEANVSYTSLFSMIGFDASGLNLNASSEVPVMGV